MQLAAGTVVDRYTIEGPLGQGGMAVVYRARHNQLGTLHAVKVLQVSTPSIRERLLQEGRVQAVMRHPNIVSVTDVIDVNGSPGLVMELIQGVSLEQLLNRAPLTLEQADELARGIIAGVAEAHRLGLIHRDLKPGNVMLQTTASGLIPKVTDFGLAKVLSADDSKGTTTRSGVTMGTPCFMAPEQIRDAKSADKRADVFSLGAILYELVTNRRAFEQPDIVGIFNAVTTGDFIPPTTLVPGLPESMNQAILGALKVNRDERIQDCDQLLATWTGKVAVGQAIPRGPWSDELLKSVTEEASRSGQPTAVPPKSEATWGDGGSPAPATLNPDPQPRASVAPKSSGPESDLGWAPPQRRVPWVVVGVVVVLVALVGAGLVGVSVVGLGFAWATQADAPKPDAIVTVPPAVLVPPEPVVVVDPVVEPPPVAIVTPPPPVHVATPVRHDPVPKPPELPPNPPEPTPKPVVAGMKVSVEGDATKVKLVRDGREYDVPGSVPAGTYTILATFPASQPVSAGNVTVTDGPVKLSCGAAFQKCRSL